MTTYFTKCGREFSKSTKAETTGYHIPEDEFGQITDQECSDCPFPIDVKEGYPEQRHKRWECRAGSQPPNHMTEWRGSLEDKNTIQIYSLDHELMEQIIAFATDYPDLSASYNQDSLADCRRTLSISCSGNKKGIAAKKELIEKFFPDKPAMTRAEIAKQCGWCEHYPEGGKDIEPCDATGENVSRWRPSQPCPDWMPRVEGSLGIVESIGPGKSEIRKTDVGTMEVDEWMKKTDALLKKIDAEDSELEESVNEAPENVTEAAESVNDSVPDVIKPVEVEQTPTTKKPRTYRSALLTDVSALDSEGLIEFDYTNFEEDDIRTLREIETEIAKVKVQTVFEIGRRLSMAKKVLSNHRNGTFGAWCESIGFSRDSADNYVRAHEFILRNFGNIDNADSIQPSVLFAASKPSAPPELAEAVISGDITKHKDYQEAMKKLKQVESHYQTVSESYDQLQETNRKHFQRTQELETRLKSVEQGWREKLDQANSATAKAERMKAEAERQRDQAKEKLNGGLSRQVIDLTAEVNELREQLNSKPIEVPAVEVKEVIPEDIRIAWTRRIYDSMLFLAELKESDVNLLVKLDGDGGYDNSDASVYDALAENIIEKMRMIQRAFEGYWAKEEPADAL